MKSHVKNSVSVITVCLNAEDNIEKTILSVLGQEGENIEYIIKDGGSTDKTLKIINSYKPQFEEKKINYIIISQEDSGIYDAMNQAVSYCSNKWVIFMNAGDLFFDNCVIKDIFWRNYENNVGIVFGHAKYMLSKGYNIIIESNLTVSSQLALCHQAIFMRKDLLAKYKFDTTYKIVADRELVFRIISAAYKAYKVNTIVCIYARDGVSAMDYVTLRREIYECNKKYGIHPNKYNYYISVLKKYMNRICPVLADMILCKKSMKNKKGKQNARNRK